MYAKKQGGALEIALTVPSGTTAEVRLPQGYSRLECGELSGEMITLTAGEHKVIARK